MVDQKNDAKQAGNPVSQPGATIAPESATVQNNSQPAAPLEHAQANTATLQPEGPLPETPSPIVSSETQTAKRDDQTITWNASEFIGHEKTTGWYLALIVITVLFAAAMYFLTKDLVTVTVIIVGGILLGIFGTHRPNQLEYALTKQDIRIGAKRYPYDEFQFFIVTPASAYPEITLIPLKRFMPPLSLRYPSADESKVLDVLAQHLPSEERRPDLIDSLMRFIHF